MTEKFEGIYFDGLVNKKRRVTLIFSDALEICDDGAVLTVWPYSDMRRISAPPDEMRLRAIGAAELAHLDIRAGETQREVERHCPKLADDEAHEGSTLKIVGWSLAATASIIGLVWFGVPFAADRLAPLVPMSWEKRLGDVAERQMRQMFDGKSCTTPKGAAALAKLSKRLQDASSLRMPASIEALSSKTPNAFALPGGKVFVLAGLLEKAQSQDEILGVLAHELGHLKNRDHLRHIIADGGTAYLFGLLFGDVTGGGAVVFIGKTLLTTANSREAEARADAFAGQALANLGRPAKPLGELLLRVTGKEEDGFLTILHDHPLSEDKLAKLSAADKATADPVLTAEEWMELKKICD